MPRAKKIDPEAAVQAAMALFWKHGYGGLGTRQLEEETGITRFTLQTSYGGKLPLFLSALDAYLDMFETHALPDATDGKLDSLAVWFENRAKPEMLADIACYGCLMLNSSVEFAAQNQQVSQRAARYFNMLHKGFYEVLTAVKKASGVASNFDANAMADVLMGATLGLNIVIRSAECNSAGTNMAESIATLVRSWQV